MPASTCRRTVAANAASSTFPFRKGVNSAVPQPFSVNGFMTRFVLTLQVTNNLPLQQFLEFVDAFQAFRHQGGGDGAGGEAFAAEGFVGERELIDL